jgi:NAD(P)-dependent dehydrogenase (short-subunit alcohol dehydrogenase family)
MTWIMRQGKSRFYLKSGRAVQPRLHHLAVEGRATDAKEAGRRGYIPDRLGHNETTDGLTARGKAILAHVPFGRFGEKTELCGAVIFLISDAASGFVTGVTIPVDGGYLTNNI